MLLACKSTKRESFMEDSTQKVKQNDTEKYHSKTEYKCEEPVTLSHLEEMKSDPELWERLPAREIKSVAQSAHTHRKSHKVM